ncbi:MAG: hypothetical protein ACR2O4_05510 [Hyphomicrobiaceae bacterium]
MLKADDITPPAFPAAAAAFDGADPWQADKAGQYPGLDFKGFVFRHAPRPVSATFFSPRATFETRGREHLLAAI